MMTFGEYMAFFDKWLNYQFPRDEDADDLAYWSTRDNWTMYYSVKDLA